jgi:sialate O-acetylesterase
VWNNKKCAVSLTYDDALNVHLDNAIPILDSLGFKATFYLSAYMPGCKDRLEDWKAAARRGHELGNHTLFHPCTGGVKGREWVSVERDLSRYSMDRFIDEIRMTNVFLKTLDGKSQRTFAYTCGDTLVQDQSVVTKIMSDFVSARGVKGELVSFTQKNIFNVGSYMISGQSSAEMIRLVTEAMRTNSAIVFLFHGVGGEHGLNVGLKEHRELLQFLKANENEIWVAPFIEVTGHMKNKHKGTTWR